MAEADGLRDPRRVHRAHGGTDRFHQRGVPGSLPAPARAAGDRCRAPAARGPKRHERAHRLPSSWNGATRNDQDPGRRRRPFTARAGGSSQPPPALDRSTRPARPDRLGILGGTFDPPHLGHLWLATMAADELGLSKVLFVPAATPPHKRRRSISHAADRVLMTRLAVANDPRLDVSLVELEREGPSYTVDTLVELRQRHPDAGARPDHGRRQPGPGRHAGGRRTSSSSWRCGRSGRDPERRFRRGPSSPSVGAGPRPGSTSSAVRRSTSVRARSDVAWRPAAPSATLCRGQSRSSSSSAASTAADRPDQERRSAGADPERDPPPRRAGPRSAGPSDRGDRVRPQGQRRPHAADR